VIVLQGDVDLQVPIRDGSPRRVQAIAGTELKTVADTGHCLQYVHPEAAAEAVMRLHQNM